MRRRSDWQKSPWETDHWYGNIFPHALAKYCGEQKPAEISRLACGPSCNIVHHNATRRFRQAGSRARAASLFGALICAADRDEIDELRADQDNR
jgi:hypothetical protein